MNAKKDRKPKKDERGRVRPCEHRWRECKPKASEILKRAIPPFKECTRCYDVVL